MKLDIQTVFSRFPLATTIIGKRRSGKSKLLIEMLNSKYFKNLFEEIYIFSPTAHIDDTFDNLDNDKCEFVKSFDVEKMESILNRQSLIPKSERENILLVVDDFADKTSTSKNNKINEVFFRGRHFGISIIITSQKFVWLPPIIRNNADEIILFRASNKKEFNTICDELDDINLKIPFEKVLDYSTKGYDYLCIIRNRINHFIRGNLLNYKYLDVNKQRI